MKIPVNSHISLHLINESHALPIFELVDQNRVYLREWLSFVDKMDTIAFAKTFVKGTQKRNQEGVEFAFVIVDRDVVMGRIGVYKIDQQNKIGEIGYWISEKAQGQGIVHLACSALLPFCFNVLGLNRIEIKCGVENSRSQSIPSKLGFVNEGMLRQSEWLYDKFIDLYLYSLLKEDFLVQ